MCTSHVRTPHSRVTTVRLYVLNDQPTAINIQPYTESNNNYNDNEA